MDDVSLPGRVLRTGLGVAVWFVLLFLIGGRSDIALGLATGCGLSLGSFWSLAWLVPRLLVPGKRRTWLLGFVFLLKLPVYGLVLYYALATPAVNGMAVFAGVALVPAVITLKAIGRLAVKTAATRSQV